MTQTEDWHKERQQGIGGADVPAIMGVDRYRTPLDVWKEKVSTTPIYGEDNTFAEAGRRLEDTIAQWWSDKSGLQIRRKSKAVVHKEVQILRAHIDKEIVYDPRGLLEVKNRSDSAFAKWPEDDLPQSEKLQVQHYMHVLSSRSKRHYRWGEVAILVGGNRLERVPVEIDGSYTEIMDYLVEWWQKHVIEQVPPEPITEREVKELYPAVSGKAIEAAPDTLEVYEKAKTLKTMIERLQEKQQRFEEQLKIAMMDAEALKLDGDILATWGKAKDGTEFDKGAFKRDYPQLYEKYLVPKEGSRRFLYK